MTLDSTDLFGPVLDRRVVPVLVPMPAPRAYSYAVPDGMAVEPGSIVQVPLGPVSSSASSGTAKTTAASIRRS